jgi:hypothetical protein
MLSVASSHIIAIILLASLLPGAKADCWVDTYVYLSNHISAALFILLNLITLSFFSSPQHFRNTGDETCDGLSNLARALIGLAFCTYHHIVDPRHNIPPLYLH